MIELGIVDLLFQRIKKSDLKRIESCITTQEKDLVEGDMLIPRGDIAFHKALALATHNKVLINFFNDSLMSLILNGLTGFSFKKEDLKHSLDLNRKIFSFIVKKDKKSAKREMKIHFDWLIKLINK